MALPTSGNEVYNIVTKPFDNQTIERDGKTIKLIQRPNIVSIEIFY